MCHYERGNINVGYKTLEMRKTLVIKLKWISDRSLASVVLVCVCCCHGNVRMYCIIIGHIVAGLLKEVVDKVDCSAWPVVKEH